MMLFFNSIAKNTDTPVVQNIRVYYMIGQSNMDGRGLSSELPTYLQGNIPNCFYFNVDNWTQLTAINTSSSSQVGPIGEFAYRMQEKYPNDLHYFIFEGQGSTSLAVNWNPDTGANYANFESKWNAALLLLSGESYIKMGGCWMQGESDALNETWANAYETNQTAFVSAINGLTGTTNFIDGRIHEDLPDGTLPYDIEVRTAKDNNFTNNITDGLIDTDLFTLKTDSIHFDTAGQIQLGNAFAQYF